MKTNNQYRFTLKGMANNIPENVAPDVYCAEIINLRNRNGSWQPVGKKHDTGLKVPTGNYTFFAHNLPNGSTNILGYNSDTGYVDIINTSTGEPTPVTYLYTNKKIRFQYVGNMVVIFNDTDKDTSYIWFDTEINSYRFIPSLPDPICLYFTANMIDKGQISVNVTDKSEHEDYINAINAAVFTKLQEWYENENLVEGYISYIITYELYDGTHVSHSPLRTIYAGNSDGIYHVKDSKLVKGKPQYYVRIRNLDPAQLFYVIPATFTNKISTLKNNYKNIIKNVTVWASEPKSKFNSSGKYPYVNNQEIESYHQPYKFKQLLQENKLFKILSIPLEELSTTNGKQITLPKFNTWSALEMIQVDPNSLHKLHSHTSIVYNSAIWHGNLTVKYYNGYPLTVFSPFNFSGSTYQISLDTFIRTSAGTIITRSSFSINSNVLYLPLIISYPHVNAYKINVVVKPNNDPNYYIIKSYTLYQHPFLNLAYGILDHDENDTVDIPSLNQRDVYTQIGTNLSGFQRAGYTPDVTHPLANVVAVTTIDNPLVAPPAYRLSLAGTVTGIGINTSPLATEPHGTHPVIIITTNGLVAVQLSAEGYPQGNVAIGGEPGMPGQTLSGQGYIIYNSNRGLQLWQSGRSVAIQEIIAGITKGNRITGAVHDKLTTNLTAIVGYLSNDNKDYLSMIVNGQLTIDDTYNELIICNPDYNYSLVYNLQSKMWYKRTDTYNIIMYGNKPHGINNGKIYDLTAEDYDEPTDCYILTLPVKIASDGVNKHLSHITVNGLLDSGNNIVAMAIYGSQNDYTPYYPVVATATKGDKPLIASKSGYSNVYYIIEIAGKLLKDSYISHLSGDVRITQCI